MVLLTIVLQHLHSLVTKMMFSVHNYTVRFLPDARTEKLLVVGDGCVRSVPLTGSQHLKSSASVTVAVCSCVRLPDAAM